MLYEQGLDGVGKYDDLLADLPPAGSGDQTSGTGGRFDDLINDLPPLPKKQDLASKIYHPIIEGGAMTLGGLAGAPFAPETLGAAPVATAAAMYPPAKNFANSIDRMRGITPEEENPIKDFGTGLGIEAGSRLLGTVAKPTLEAIGKVVPGKAVGTAVSGTTPSNLSRAYNGGFWKTFISPKSLDQASENYGNELSKLMNNYLTPEQQANILINPRGEANQTIASAYSKFLNGESLGPQEAVAAKKSIDVVYPPGTPKNFGRIAEFNRFEDHLDNVISKTAPSFKQANDDYAASKLRSQLLKFGQVNKSNPNEYSKLSALIFESLAGMTGFGGHSLAGAMGILGTQAAMSPLAMGLVSTAAGNVSRIAETALQNPIVRRAISSALDHYFSRSSSNSGQDQKDINSNPVPGYANSGNQQ